MESHLHLDNFSFYHQKIKKTISFRPVRLEQDLEMLHQWMHEPHVIPFWNRALSLEKYEVHLRDFLKDTHQSLHIGSLNDVPISYWETYWVKDDVLGKSYDVHPDDQGIHLLFGPTSYLGKGYALPFLSTMVYCLFQHEKTEKVVTEPDIRNEKMIHIFKKCGFELQKNIKLPDKEAALMFCHREPFLRSWNDV
jgi:RimJ/RimL family protein N-acetyltransferase